MDREEREEAHRSEDHAYDRESHQNVAQALTSWGQVSEIRVECRPVAYAGSPNGFRNRSSACRSSSPRNAQGSLDTSASESTAVRSHGGSPIEPDIARSVGEDVGADANEDERDHPGAIPVDETARCRVRD
jgi:hypothetical protein